MKSRMICIFLKQEIEACDFRREYQHLEYIPLINSRAHQLGQKRRILNEKFKAQYTRFITRAISLSSSIRNLPPTEMIQAVYYLLLQVCFLRLDCVLE